MKCSEKLSSSGCPECSDKECVLQSANKIAEKKLGNKIKEYQVILEEEQGFYIITYTNLEFHNDHLKKGGDGLMFKISKENCRIVDYKRFK